MSVWRLQRAGWTQELDGAFSLGRLQVDGAPTYVGRHQATLRVVADGVEVEAVHNLNATGVRARPSEPWTWLEQGERRTLRAGASVSLVKPDARLGGDGHAEATFTLRQGAAAEVVAANKLVVFSPLSFDGLGSFFLAVGATLLCCGCYCFLCCREWWCRSKWKKIRMLQHF